MCETYIFRFRDLGKSEGFTIEQHNNIARQEGNVWWGWWAKSGERFPSLELKNAAEKNKQIYFFDSGRLKFYTAVLKDTCSSALGDIKKQSPKDGRRTPAYYNENELLGWLNVSDIIEIDACDILKKFTYIPLDALFAGNKDLDEQLFNKIVFSSAELKKQDRTIWKIRPANDKDLQHESLASHYVPYNFSRKYSQKKGEFIIWLSDIHFDGGNGKHAFPTQDNDQLKCLSSRVVELAGKYNNGSKCAGLAISGDLTWQSQKEGFEQALNFIKDVSSSLSLTTDDIIICPGNHDVGLVSKDEYFKIVGKPVTDKPWKILAENYHSESKLNYIKFYRDFFQREPEENLSQGRKFLLGGHKVVEIAALNSCVLQQVKDSFLGMGFVGEQQLSDVAKSMGWMNDSGGDILKKKGVIRIAMLHHHLTSINEVEDAYLDSRYSVTLDAERLLRWVVRHKVDYILHGHMHRSSFITITKKLSPLEPVTDSNPEHTFQIVSLGSSGVVSSELPSQDCANYACVLDFSGEKLTFNFFKLDKQSGEKVAATYIVEGLL
ncbi:metallophosphoesterase family protein [Escherichia coli]|uniref:metallophosphoesterase family protein n=1 Tax=Escherichia coli TaxID=562 RepID=UPI00128D1FEC|nr:metallophosphoesterase [Escherichia coli]MPU10970.1 metallophosphoesterase [Escherichia coli]